MLLPAHRRKVPSKEKLIAPSIVLLMPWGSSHGIGLFPFTEVPGDLIIGAWIANDVVSVVQNPAQPDGQHESGLGPGSAVFQ